MLKANDATGLAQIVLEIKKNAAGLHEGNRNFSF